MLDLESIVFSRVKAQIPEKIKTKYKDLDFTTSNRSQTNPKFPCVYVHMMLSPESGADTEGDNINAVNTNFQIEVTDNQSQTRAKEVANEVTKIMKSMRFQVVGMPFNENTDSVYRVVARFRRTIAEEDIL